MSPVSRRRVLWLALVLTLVAVWLAPGKRAEVVLTERVRQSTQVQRPESLPHQQVAADVRLGRPETGAPPGGAGEVLPVVYRVSRDYGNSSWQQRLFAAVRWQPPAQSAPPPAPLPVVAKPRPAPRPPPLPFRVLGRYRDREGTVVFLQSVRDNLVVRAGDLLARKYRVEGIDENALHLRYLPLDVVQQLELGDTRGMR